MKLDLQKLRCRVLDISYKHGLSHVGSCLTALECLVKIFDTEQPPVERFVLSCGHAGLALYVVLEALGKGSAELRLERYGIHPCKDAGTDCSTGSLGQGITVAVGMALAGKETYCLISDGECAEGSVWEALAFKHLHKLHNLHIHVNVNGYSAISKVDTSYLFDRLRAFDPDITLHFTKHILPSHQGVDAHYHSLTKEEYETAVRILSA